MILVSTIGFYSYARHSGEAKKYIRHCIVGKIKDGHNYFKVKQ